MSAMAIFQQLQFAMAALADSYDKLAARYHLIFEDWETSVARQAAVLKASFFRRLAASFPFEFWIVLAA